MNKTKVLGRMLLVFKGELIEISKREVNARDNHRTTRYFVKVRK
jgi:hypothetical protein